MWTCLASLPNVLACLEAWVSRSLQQQLMIPEESKAAVVSVLQSEPRTGTLKVRGELDFQSRVAGRRLFCSSECPGCVICEKVT